MGQLSPSWMEEFKASIANQNQEKDRSGCLDVLSQAKDSEIGDTDLLTGLEDELNFPAACALKHEASNNFQLKK